jgi:enoyl-CoA hydratase/carnithine racemase
MASYQAIQYPWRVHNATVSMPLNRPELKNPINFVGYIEHCELLNQLQWTPDVKAVVLTGEGGNFCADGDVHEIIGLQTALKAPVLQMSTSMTDEQSVENLHVRV